ncbi:hypothetical protein HZS_3733, partial [Henneguya salminicola]
MFSDISIYTLDFSIKLIDGFIIFKWWKVPRKDKNLTLDLLTENKDSILKINYNVHAYIRGLEIHFYNRYLSVILFSSSRYERILKFIQKYN